MCRLLSLPPLTTRAEAIALLRSFEGRNRDGVGSVHLDPVTKALVVVKYPESLSFVVNQRRPFLDHLPHQGWTIVHLRAATGGMANLVPDNTHPFITADWGVAHNGYWRDYKLPRLMFIALGWGVKGVTDSEAAAHFFDLVGPETFSAEVGPGNGVYMALNRHDGSLVVVKTSGDLEVITRTSEAFPGVTQHVLASTFPHEDYPSHRELMLGTYTFKADGSLLRKELRTFKDPKRAIRVRPASQGSAHYASMINDHEDGDITLPGTEDGGPTDDLTEQEKQDAFREQFPRFFEGLEAANDAMSSDGATVIEPPLTTESIPDWVADMNAADLDLISEGDWSGVMLGSKAVRNGVVVDAVLGVPIDELDSIPDDPVKVIEVPRELFTRPAAPSKGARQAKPFVQPVPGARAGLMVPLGPTVPTMTHPYVVPMGDPSVLPPIPSQGHLVRPLDSMTPLQGHLANPPFSAPSMDE